VVAKKETGAKKEKNKKREKRNYAVVEEE